MSETLPGREFLLAGGRITYEEWASLDADQRASLAEAGALIMQEQADMIVDSLAERIGEFVDQAKLEAEAEKIAKGVPA